jgi:hypothetical protein
MGTTWRARGWKSVGLLAIFLAAGLTSSPAILTGIPIKVVFTPAPVEQAKTSAVTATVQLRKPSPSFFICQLRSDDPRVIIFQPIIFSRGQTTGKAIGSVNWNAVHVAKIKVTVYSTDNPLLEISGFILLKPGEDADSPNGG